MCNNVQCLIATNAANITLVDPQNEVSAHIDIDSQNSAVREEMKKEY